MRTAPFTRVLRLRFCAFVSVFFAQHDEVGQATLLNLLLRSLLAEDQVEQAFKLVSQTTFPEKASNNQFCRYLYYTVNTLFCLQASCSARDALRYNNAGKEEVASEHAMPRACHACHPHAAPACFLIFGCVHL